MALAVENSIEEDYVTEKMWQPLKMGAVPIALGRNVSQHLLPHTSAAIYAEDFSSVEELAGYIKKVSNSSWLWHTHTAWKVGNFSRTFQRQVFNSFASLGCRICEGYWKHKQGNPPQELRMPELHMSLCQKDLLSRLNVLETSPLPVVDARLGVEMVFVVHYTPLAHRKQAIVERLHQTFSATGFFVTEFDKEVLTQQDLNCMGSRLWQTWYTGRNNTKGEDSLCIKHMAIYYYMYRNRIRNALVLEDYAAFVKRSPHWWLREDQQWQNILRDLPQAYDMVMLCQGASPNMSVSRKFGPNLVLAQESSTTGMYLVSLKGAINMLNSLPLVGPIDFHINYVAGKKPIHGRHNATPPPANVEGIQIFHADPFMSFQKDSLRIGQTVGDFGGKKWAAKMFAQKDKYPGIKKNLSASNST